MSHATALPTKPSVRQQLREAQARIKELETGAAEPGPTTTAPAADGDNVYEYRFPIPDHATGGHAYIALRKCHDTGWWAVTDGSAGLNPEQFWNGRCWQLIMPWVPTAQVHGWRLLEEARAQVPALLESAAAAHRAYAENRERLARIEAIAATTLTPEAAPAEATKAVVEEVAKAEAVITRRHAKPGVTVPAAKDMPGYGENASRMAATVRDSTLAQMAETDADQEFLTRLGKSIAATTTPIAPEPDQTPEADAETTTVIDTATVRELTGMGDTQQMPAVLPVAPVPPAEAPELPPIPKLPPRLAPQPVLWSGGEVRPLSDLRPVQFAKAGAK